MRSGRSIRAGQRIETTLHRVASVVRQQAPVRGRGKQAVLVGAFRDVGHGYHLTSLVHAATSTYWIPPP